MFKIRLIYILLPAAISIAVACNKPASPGNSGAQGVSPSFLGEPIYPHSADFKTKLHGQAFLHDKTTCAKCHGSDYSGGSAQVSCKTCHDQFPHAAGWGSPQRHGVEFLKLPAEKRQTCTQCHSTDNPAGTATSGISCQTCHSEFPHSDTFIAGGHSQAYLSGQSNCLGCHESVKRDLPDMATAVSCQTCHASYFPHPSQWALPTNHGQQYTQLKPDGKKECLACHSGEKPSSGINCNQCHSAFPHSDEFVNGGHAAQAKTFEGKCLACHTDYKRNMPNFSDKGCLTCHDGKINVGWQPEPPAAAPAPAPSPSPAPAPAPAPAQSSSP